MGGSTIFSNNLSSYFKAERPVELYIPGKKLTYGVLFGPGGCIMLGSTTPSSSTGCYNYAPTSVVVTDGCDYSTLTSTTPTSPVICSNSRLYGVGSNDYSQLGG